MGSEYSTAKSQGDLDDLIIAEASRQGRRFRILERAAKLADEAQSSPTPTPTLTALSALAAPKPVAFGSMTSLPIVNVSAMHDRDASHTRLQATGAAVHNACIEHGFMYITGTSSVDGAVVAVVMMP